MSFGNFQTGWLPGPFQYFQPYDNSGMSYKSKFYISALSVASRTWQGRWKGKKEKKIGKWIKSCACRNGHNLRTDDVLFFQSYL